FPRPSASVERAPDCPPIVPNRVRQRARDTLTHRPSRRAGGRSNLAEFASPLSVPCLILPARVSVQPYDPHPSVSVFRSLINSKSRRGRADYNEAVRRRLFQVVAISSLLLCAASAALWARSFWATDLLAYH